MSEIHNKLPLDYLNNKMKSIWYKELAIRYTLGNTLGNGWKYSLKLFAFLTYRQATQILASTLKCLNGC